MLSFLQQLRHYFSLSLINGKYFYTFAIPSMVLCHTEQLCADITFNSETNGENLKCGNLLRIIKMSFSSISC